MVPENEPVAACLGVLDEIIRASSDVTALADLVTPGFDIAGLEWLHSDPATLQSVSWVENQLVIAFKYSSTDYPFRCTFASDELGRWRLTSFEYGCPACFGDGLLNDSTCSICNGTGYDAN